MHHGEQLSAILLSKCGCACLSVSYSACAFLNALPLAFFEADPRYAQLSTAVALCIRA